MNASGYLFWNVDTQFDFVSPKGKLYVKDAELLLWTWKELTQLASGKSIKVVNTADWHLPNSEELSVNPDFINTFPEHCMANSLGAEFVNETNPENPLIINWDEEIEINSSILSEGQRNFIIRKDAFDVFKGNPYTEKLLNLLSPKTVVVYGVTTNVCVNDAVVGLSKRVKKVIVVQDAIKELPNIPLPFENWERLGVFLMNFREVEALLK
jgi:nicotinamidase/pyrazinamidase